MERKRDKGERRKKKEAEKEAEKEADKGEREGKRIWRWFLRRECS